MGSKATISCSFKRYEPNTTWQVRSGTDFINVTSCTFGNNFCVDYMPQQYHGVVFSVSDGFSAYLIISSVRRDATEFRCLSKYGYSVNTLEVYGKFGILLIVDDIFYVCFCCPPVKSDEEHPTHPDRHYMGGKLKLCFG